MKQFENTKKYFVAIMLTVAYLASYAVVTERRTEKTVQIDFVQIKEGLNFGLVFRGPQISYGQQWILENEKSVVQFGTKVGAGILFSHEIPALCFNVVPLNFEYRHKFKSQLVEIGFYASPEYNYQLYPDLQSGFDYWFSTLSVGPSIKYQFELSGMRLTADLKTALAGLVSRTEADRDPYFFDLGVNHAIAHLNSNFQFGSVNKFNRTKFGLTLTPKKDSRLSIGYELDYFGYYAKPTCSLLNHGLKLIFKPNY